MPSASGFVSHWMMLQPGTRGSRVESLHPGSSSPNLMSFSTSFTARRIGGGVSTCASTLRGQTQVIAINRNWVEDFIASHKMACAKYNSTFPLRQLTKMRGQRLRDLREYQYSTYSW